MLKYVFICKNMNFRGLVIILKYSITNADSCGLSINHTAIVWTNVIFISFSFNLTVELESCISRCDRPSTSMDFCARFGHCSLLHHLLFAGGELPHVWLDAILSILRFLLAYYHTKSDYFWTEVTRVQVAYILTASSVVSASVVQLDWLIAGYYLHSTYTIGPLLATSTIRDPMTRREFSVNSIFCSCKQIIYSSELNLRELVNR